MSVRHRLAAIWFADIVDYSHLIASDQGRALRVVRAFQEAVTESVEAYGGRIVKFLGDGALAEFRSVQAAIAAADALCTTFDERVDRLGLECRKLRVGIHTGEIVHAEDGDVYGDGVNVAQRIQSEANPGEILVSGEASRQARQHSEIEFESLGSRELKGVGEIELHRVRLIAPIEPEEQTLAAGSGGIRGIVEELQRRHVFRVAALYGVVAWLVIQVAAATFSPLGVPDWGHTLVVVVALVGFPVVVALAWAYEWTPQGVRRTAPGRMPESLASRIGRHAIVGVSIIAAVMVGWVIFRAGTDPGVAADRTAPAELESDPARLAVLYLENRAGEDVSHLAEGLTESLIDRLSGIDALNVVPAHGVERFRGAHPDSVARMTGAGMIVDGSLTVAGEDLLVRLNLHDVIEGRQIESWTFQRPRDQVFDLRDDIVSDILSRLRPRLGERLVLSRKIDEVDVEAWGLFQRAQRLEEQIASVDDPEIERQLAGEADSLLALAEGMDRDWIEPSLARTRVQLAASDSTAEDFQAAVERVTGIRDTEHASVLTLRGQLLAGLAARAPDSTTAARYVMNAERDLRTAVAGDPDLASAWIALAGLLYNDLWDLPEARQAATTAWRKDPFLLEEDHFSWLCEISMQMKDYEAAHRWCAEGRRRYPDKQGLIFVELTMLASDGVEPDPARAWYLYEEISRLPEADFNAPPSGMLVAAVLARVGLADSAHAVARRTRIESASILDQYPSYEAYVGYIEARMHLVLGDRDRALDLLDRFLTVLPGYRAQVADDHFFQDLTGDPRYERLVDRQRRPIFCRLLCEPPG